MTADSLTMGNAPAVGSPRKTGVTRGLLKKKEKKERIHITLGQSSLAILEELGRKTDTNNTMVFRNALRLYAALIEEAEKGNDFYTRSPDGDYVRYKVFL